jgi:hypothetical protein
MRAWSELGEMCASRKVQISRSPSSCGCHRAGAAIASQEAEGGRVVREGGGSRREEGGMGKAEGSGSEAKELKK